MGPQPDPNGRCKKLIPQGGLGGWHFDVCQQSQSPLIEVEPFFPSV